MMIPNPARTYNVCVYEISPAIKITPARVAINEGINEPFICDSLWTPGSKSDDAIYSKLPAATPVSTHIYSPRKPMKINDNPAPTTTPNADRKFKNNAFLGEYPACRRTPYSAIS